MKLATGEDAPQELVDLLQPGNKVKVYAGENIPVNNLYHILTIVDDDQIVYKIWGKHKQLWFYRVEDAYLFYLYWRDGWLSKG